jgi:ATP-binding protein involved in chromosome partitioning
MADVTEAGVRQALGTVRDPDRAVDIVSAGMVSGLHIKDGHVLFSIEVDPARGAALEPMRKAAEKAVEGLDGVLSATAVLTAHREVPNRPAAPAPGGGRAAAAAPAPQGTGQAQAPGQGAAGRKQDVPGVRHIVAVASGKGGVGKSTVAANLALALARLGLAVGLLDADIYGPSMPRMLGVGGKPESPDGKTLDPKRAHGIAMMSIGLLVDEETPMIWRGPMVQSALTQMLRDVNWGDLDVLIVDMPPGTGDAQLTMAQQVPLSGAVIVSTPQDIALLDARKGLNMFRKVDVPVFGIVENMSVFVCPDCGSRHEIFGHGGAKAEAERLGVPFLGDVPLHLAIRETGDAGTPVVAAEPDSPHAKAFLAVAEAVRDAVTGDAAPRRTAPRISVE